VEIENGRVLLLSLAVRLTLAGSDLAALQRMTVKQAMWLLRIGFPAVTFAISLLCGRSVAGSFGILTGTALIIIVSAGGVLGLAGLPFAPRAEIYSANAEKRLLEPDTQLFLFSASRPPWLASLCFRCIANARAL
jgi:hypothetical protein